MVQPVEGDAWWWWRRRKANIPKETLLTLKVSAYLLLVTGYESMQMQLLLKIIFRLLLTNMLSAIWHGVEPGFYMTFLSAVYFTIAARKVSSISVLWHKKTELHWERAVEVHLVLSYKYSSWHPSTARFLNKFFANYISIISVTLQLVLLPLCG